jgi:hypothetical protein
MRELINKTTVPWKERRGEEKLNFSSSTDNLSSFERVELNAKKTIFIKKTFPPFY